MNPAAILRTQIQVEGYAQAVSQMERFDALSRKAAGGSTVLTNATKGTSSAVSTTTRSLGGYAAAARQTTPHVGQLTDSTKKSTGWFKSMRTSVGNILPSLSTLRTRSKGAASETESLASKAKRGASNLFGLSKGLVAAGLAFIGYEAAKNAVETTAQLGEATVRLTAATGMNTKTASSWLESLKARGLALRSVSLGFITFSKQMTAAEKGTKSSVEAFNSLGISEQFINSHSTEQTLLAAANGFEKLHNPAQRAAIVSQLFGRAGQFMVPILAQGKKGIDEMLASDQALGAYLPNSTKRLREAHEANVKLNEALDGIKIAFTEAVLPYLVKGANAFFGFIKQAREGKGAGGEFAKVVGSLFKNFLIPVFSTFFKIIKTFAPLLILMLKGVGWVVQHTLVPALHVFAAGVDFLSKHLKDVPGVAKVVWQHVEHWFGQGVSIILGFITGFLRGISTMLDGLSNIPIIGDKFGHMRDSVNHAIDSINHFRDEARKWGTETPKQTKKVSDAFKNMVPPTSGALHNIANIVNTQTGRALRQGSANTHKLQTNISSSTQKARNDTHDDLGAMLSIIGDRTSRSASRAGTNMSNFAGNIKTWMQHAVNATASGGNIILGQTKQMLSGFGVGSGLSKLADITVKKVGFARGGVVDRPSYMVGEEAPQHPEVVISTNPRDRKSNLGFWAKAGQLLNVPGFAKGGYVFPYPSTAYMRRTDQGVDTAIPAGGLFRAMGNAIIGATNIGGWPGGPLMNWRLTSGSAAGREVYLAEMIRPLVHTGQRVRGNTAVAVSTGPSQEMGWWAGGPSGATLAQYLHEPLTDASGVATAAGKSFRDFIFGGKVSGVGAGLAAIASLIAPKVTGGGVMGQVVEGALKKMTAGANKYIAAHAPAISGGGSIGPLTANTGNVLRDIFKTLKARGWGPLAIAAAMGNAYQESSWQPGIEVGGNGGLWGFTSGAVSLASLKAAAAQKGVSWQNASLQAAFMAAHYGDLGTLNSYRDLAQATAYFMNTFEKPLASAANLPNRIRGAQRAQAMGYKHGGFLPPFGGIFGDGGVVPGPLGAPRTIIAHGGEPVGASDSTPVQVEAGPMINIETMNVHDQFDEQALAARLSFLLVNL